MTNIHACVMADARTMVAPFVAMDIPKASQLVPAVGPFLFRCCHVAGWRFASALAIAASRSGSNGDKLASSKRLSSSALSRLPLGSPNGLSKSRRLARKGGLCQGIKPKLSICTQVAANTPTCCHGSSASMESSCLARVGLSARHATRARFNASRSNSSISLITLLQSEFAVIADRFVRLGGLRRHATARTQAQHSRERRQRPDLGLPDRQPWARPVIDDIGGGQLTARDPLGDDGFRVGGEQRNIGRQKMVRGRASDEVGEFDALQLVEILGRSQQHPGPVGPGRESGGGCGLSGHQDGSPLRLVILEACSLASERYDRL